MLVYNIVNWTCIVVLITLILCGPLGVASIETHALGDFCGHSIFIKNSVGILQFKAPEFSRYHGIGPLTCTVTVTPVPLPGSSGDKVLFYFEEFQLPGGCNEVSLTLYDGPSADTDKVKGAPFQLCGYDRNLTYRSGMVFNTTGPSFTVELRWTYVQMKISDGFELKYAAYYEGLCGRNDVKCQNGRCGSLFYHCHADIDTCGGGEESTCRKLSMNTNEDPRVDPLVDKLGSISKWIAGAIAVVITSIFVVKIVRVIRRDHGSVTNFFRYKFCGGRRHGEWSRSSSRSSGSVELGNHRDASEPLNTVEPPYTQANGTANQGTPGQERLPTAEPINGISGPKPTEPPASGPHNPNGTAETVARDQERLAAGSPFYDTSGSPPSSLPFQSSHGTDSGVPTSVGTVPSLAPPSYDYFLSNEDKYEKK